MILNGYMKFIAQILATMGTALVAAMQDGPITYRVWVNVLLAGIGAVMVVGAGELPAGVWRNTKTYLSALTAGLIVLQSSMSGWDRATLLQAIVAVVAVVGVAAVPGPVLAPLGEKAGLMAGIFKPKEPVTRGRHEET